MKSLLFIILLFCFTTGRAQEAINVDLKRQLDIVKTTDQKYRDVLSLLMVPAKADSIAKTVSMTVGQANAYFWKLQIAIDSANVVFVEQIFRKYGYPGRTLVGPETSNAAWLIIQHSDKIKKYLRIIKKAATTGELKFTNYAMMLDRYLMFNNKEQIYGTQCAMRTLKSTRQNEWMVWPIKDAATVNQRRKKAGFDDTIEQYAADFNFKYKVVKLAEIML